MIGSGKSKQGGRSKTRKHPHTAASAPPPSISSSTTAVDAGPAVVPFVADSPEPARSSSKGPSKKVGALATFREVGEWSCPCQRRRSASTRKDQHGGGQSAGGGAHGKKGGTPKKPAFSAWAMFQKGGMRTAFGRFGRFLGRSLKHS